MPCQILESRHHETHEMVDAVAVLPQASHLFPLELLYQRYTTEMTLYPNAHCRLVVGYTGNENFPRIITC
jgi:hypothetical protein